ncbi:carbon-nitrogen family hydrolase [Staphylococcus caeli]|uniref:Hydrolase n=1 Tax=Staphylococcus caeli TaxID=2201815 RepID=A0A1D4K060_9STAP|nr:carbon-nitrogen family hydrolase [Staphylococcus caeli]SCS67171.1 hydrolase [Staphylococcus caeli]SCS85735.1 hydrolase [Staphylococcus caeli]
MKIQLFQFEITEANFKKNKVKISTLIEKNYTDADVIVIPEMWNNGYALPQLSQKADNNLQQSLPFIQKLAQKYNTNIIAGSVSNKKAQAIYNTSFAVSKDTSLINVTDKIHLVPMLDEHHYLESGENVPNTFYINNIKSSQIICYDLRYPEIARASVREGAEILFVVAQWTTKKLHHWRTLLQARAIENNCFVVACNSIGQVHHANHKGNTYAGHSMIIHPSGQILIEADASETVLELDIQPEDVTSQRTAIPTLDDIY